MNIVLLTLVLLKFNLIFSQFKYQLKISNPFQLHITKQIISYRVLFGTINEYNMITITSEKFKNSLICLMLN